MRLAAKQPETAKERSDDARGLRTDTRDASERARGAECDLAASSYPTRLGGNADSAVRVPILIEIRVMRDGTPSRRCAALVLAMLAPVEFARVATGARASGSRSARIRPRDSPRAPRARLAPSARPADPPPPSANLVRSSSSPRMGSRAGKGTAGGASGRRPRLVPSWWARVARVASASR